MTYTIYGKMRSSNDWQWLVLGIQSFDDCLKELERLNEENIFNYWWTEFKIVMDCD